MTKSKGLGVFLSHAKEDKSLVKELFHLLELDGFYPWLDEMMLLAGQNWQPEIEAALQRSHAIVIFVSASGVDRAGYLHKEISIAIEAAQQQPEGALYIIPVLLGNCDTPRGLSHLQWLKVPDQSNGSELAWNVRSSSSVSLYLALRPSLLRRAGQLGLVHPGEIDESEDRMWSADRGSKAFYSRSLVAPGTYLVRGHNPDGSCYFGKADIKVAGEECTIAYDISGQKTIFRGSIQGRNRHYTLEYVSQQDALGAKLARSRKNSRINLETYFDRYGVTWGGDGFEELVRVSALERVQLQNPYKA